MAKTSGGVRRGVTSHPTVMPVKTAGGALARHLKGLEDDPAYFNRNTERLYVFNQDGSLDYTLSQHNENQVRLNSRQRHRLADKILVHNHPSGGPFSKGDILMAIQYNLAEVRATGKFGTYIMRRPERGWPTTENSTTLKNIYLSTLIGMPISEAGWKLIADHFGADYAFVKRQMF